MAVRFRINCSAGIFVGVVFIAFLAGCAAPPRKPVSKVSTTTGTGTLTAVPQVAPAPPVVKGPAVVGFYHQVKKGETLWRIAKGYRVSVDELAKVNHLCDRTKIEVGQLLYIPRVLPRPASAWPTRPAPAASESFLVSEDSFIWPVRGRVISYFDSMRDNVRNKGIDIAAPEGTDVVAAKSGRVSFVSDHVKGYGKMVIIDHADQFQTVYAYNSENLVKEGDCVKQSQIIAKVGTSGRANGSYLHFEIRNNHRPQNPLHYI